MTSMTNYRILTYPICLSPSIPLPSSWKLFADEMATGHGESNGGESRLGREGDPILRSKKEPLFDVDFMAGAQVIHGASHSLMDGAFRHVIAAGGSVLAVSDDWRQGQILVMGETYGLQTVLDHLFYTHVVQRQVLQIHSSLIRVRNRGILFLGPSGIGKTTQAELWHTFCGAEILNGDMAFVQKIEHGFLGWGSPWHGSSHYCMNASVPLCALVVLKQDKSNHLRLLEGFEKVTEISKNIFYPMWLEGGTEQCVETLDSLLCSLPVYELSCRPEEGAVILLERELERNALLS